MELLLTKKTVFKLQNWHLTVVWGIIVLCLAALSTAPTAMADGLIGPMTQLFHYPHEFFSSQNPLPMGITVDDPEGIIEARCYFRFDTSLPYVSIAMKPEGENKYTAILPQPTGGTTAIEYVFLIVNGKRQVVVSPSYQVKSWIGKGQSLSNQKKDMPKYILKTPAIDLNSLRKSFKNPDTITLTHNTQSEAYGVVAGLFSEEEFIFTTVAGYFGAFRLGVEQELTPIRGFMITGEKFKSQDLRERGAAAEDQAAKSATSTPDIAGSTWEGEFFRTDSYNSTVVALTAVITKDENDRVTITTTKENLGHYLVGTIQSDGYMLLYDQYDDEDWTTFYGPSTDLKVVIADFIYPPSLDRPYPPLNVIRLTRRTTFETPITGVLHLLLN